MVSSTPDRGRSLDNTRASYITSVERGLAGTGEFRAVPSTRFLAIIIVVYMTLLELELELIHSHMAQKPVLRGEVGCACVAREVSVER